MDRRRPTLLSRLILPGATLLPRLASPWRAVESQTVLGLCMRIGAEDVGYAIGCEDRPPFAVRATNSTLSLTNSWSDADLPDQTISFDSRGSIGADLEGEVNSIGTTSETLFLSLVSRGSSPAEKVVVTYMVRREDPAYRYAADLRHWNDAFARLRKQKAPPVIVDSIAERLNLTARSDPGMLERTGIRIPVVDPLQPADLPDLPQHRYQVLDRVVCTIERGGAHLKWRVDKSLPADSAFLAELEDCVSEDAASRAHSAIDGLNEGTLSWVPEDDGWSFSESCAALRRYGVEAEPRLRRLYSEAATWPNSVPMEISSDTADTAKPMSRSGGRRRQTR